MNLWTIALSRFSLRQAYSKAESATVSWCPTSLSNISGVCWHINIYKRLSCNGLVSPLPSPLTFDQSPLLAKSRNPSYCCFWGSLPVQIIVTIWLHCIVINGSHTKEDLISLQWEQPSNLISGKKNQIMIFFKFVFFFWLGQRIGGSKTLMNW